MALINAGGSKPVFNRRRVSIRETPGRLLEVLRYFDEN